MTKQPPIFPGARSSVSPNARRVPNAHSVRSAKFQSAAPAWTLDTDMTRAGIVTVAGKPNAGKSTLLNRMIGQKLAITSQKPQSTRDRIVGIHTSGDVQMIVFDTPGLLEPKYELQQAMRQTALRAVNEEDVIVYLADASDGAPPPLHEAAGLESEPRARVIEVLNKSDLLPAERRKELEVSAPDAIFVSARTGDGVEALLAASAEREHAQVEQIGSCLPGLWLPVCGAERGCEGKLVRDECHEPRDDPPSGGEGERDRLSDAEQEPHRIERERLVAEPLRKVQAADPLRREPTEHAENDKPD